MAKFDEISRLYDETAAKVTESPEEWLKFVSTASNLYRYPFEDQLLIYAQRPDAKQAATMDFWNKELHCYVNKGAKGIALLDKSKRGNRLKYVFDMSDVHKVSDRSRMPYQWELSDAFKNDVADYLEGKHIGYASTDMDFEDRIIRIADHIAADNIDEFYDGISEKTDGSALSEVYEENRKEVVQDALSASVASMLLTRCGLDPSECEDRLTGLQYINMFNTKATVSELGNLVSTLAKPVLIDIEREVFRLSREKNIQVDNIIKKEHNQSKESERSEENGSRVHTERGLSDTEPESTGNIGRDAGSIDESREIRTGEGEIPARTQEGDLLGLSDERNTGGTPDRDRQTGIRTERADDAANEESKGRESRNAGKELVGVLSGGSDDRSRGGINDNGRDDLRLEENEDKQLSLFPTEKEQVGSIEAAEKSAAFSMTDDLKLAVERAVKNHDTIYIQEPEEFHFSDQPYPVANANLEKFTNERLAYEEESDSYLLLADTEHDKGVWLRVFDLADEEPGRVAKELCNYIESHQMSVSGIVAHEDLAEKDYVFRIYAGAAVSEPVLWEDVITAHSYQEAQNIAEKLADGKPYSINDVDELVSRAEPVIQNGDRQELSVGEEYLINMDSSELARKFAKSAVAWDEIDSLGFAFNGWQGEQHPMFTENNLYGKNLHGDELINLAYRFRDGFTDGTDQRYLFDRDLSVGLLGTKGSFNLDSVGMDYEVNNVGHFVISRGDVSRELSYEQVSNAYLTMFREEYERNIEPEEEFEETQDVRYVGLDSFDLVADDIRNIHYVSSEYSNFGHTAEHELTAKIEGKTQNLHYEVNYGDGDDESFSIHTDENDIYDRMPTPEIRKLEGRLNDEVRVGRYAEKIEKAESAEELNNIRYEFMEDEKFPTRLSGWFWEAYNAAEEKFIEPVQGTYRIYQMKDGEEYHYAHFEPMDILEKEGIKLNRDDYNLMYEGDLSEIKGADDNDRLQAIFDKFGNNYEGSRPENFKGYSLSVSDVITFDKGNGEEPHFVDSFGFKDFPGFLQDKELARDSEEVTLPNVKVQWSESSLFEDGKTYSVAEYDSIMHEADLTRHSKQQELEEKYGSFDAWLESGDQTEYAGYDKTKFTVNFKDGSYVTERHDIGDGIGGLLEFMAQYDNFADKMPELREAAGREEDKQSYQLVIHNKNARGENPYRKKAAYRTEKEASAVGKEWISNSSVYDGYGVYNLETGRIENAVGNFTADIPVYDGILGEDFKEKYTIALEADAEELENLNSLADNNFSDLLTLSDGDYLVDNDGILWNVENAGDFMLRLDVAEENKVDTLITTRSYMMWQDKVQKNGTFDDYTNYRPITVEDYLKERKEAAYVSEVMQQKKDLGIDVQPLNPDEVEIITVQEEPEIDTEKLEEQIGILKDENIGFRSLIDRDDVSASEKAEYRSKLTANLNEIERLGGIVANERIRVSEQADSVEIKDTDRWKLVSEADPYSDSGTLTEWATQLKDGSYVWIDKEGESYAVYNVPDTDRKPMAEFPTLDEAKDYAESELIPVIEEAALGQNVLKTPEELSGTEFIVQLPDEMQKKIREAVSLVDGADVETAMSGRLADLEDNINWREVLSSDISQKQEKTAEKSGNFHITDYDLGKGGAKEKCQRNIDAIKTLLKVEKEGRAATPEEQAVMSQYIGWGGLADVFDERKANWNVERLELKRILSDDEFAAARSSTTDAFYTSPEVIDGIYGTLDRMGFEKGNILEPSMGVGNFFGMLPEKMQGSKLYGVELDSISGRIGKQLYPDARIQISGYQDTNFSNNSFDVAVGNVPFGDYKPFDRDYKKQNFVLHDYFFAKTLDKVRPGGVIAFVTSKGTMDKEDPKVRKYIAQRAEFLGAVRLPGGKDGAFKENAGTEVTSDIIFLQKRDGIADVDPDWVHLSMDKNGIAMNSYFAEHPEQIVGYMEMVSGRFGPEAACIADKDKPFKEQYAKALLGINGRYAAAERNGKDTQDYAETLLPSPEDKNYSFIVRNDRVYFRKNTELIPKELKSDAEERIKGMVEIRDLTQNLLNIQLDDAKESEIATAQIKLGEAYDTFVKKYGRINSPKNKSAFQQDSSYSLLRSLEKYDDNNEYQGKSDIFTKRTIQKAVVVSSVESASEALSVCLNEKAAVDIPFMARLCHKPENEVIEDLRGIIFKNPLTERYETSDEYLSGNVRSKLALAKNYAEQNPEYAINVAALEAVQPKELSAGDIDVRLGASWIDPKYINDFMREVLDTSWYEMRNGTIGVSFNDVTASWWIEGKTKDRYNSKVNQVYGTERKNAYELLEDSLNLKATTVYDSWIDENGCRKSEINKQATMAAQQKQDELKETFKSWIFQDPQRRQELVTLYNEKFNSTRPREYNGDYITLPGSNPQITLKPHQKNAVARIISGNNTLLAHCVGAGKTFTMAAAAMESKRLGLCKKSLFVVPNHLTEQWGSEFRTLYPNANILVATKKDFEPARRKEFCARIATGDYDAVIIGHTQFEKIPVSPEKEAAFIQSEIDNAKRTIEELSYSKADRHSVKDIEKFIKKRTEQLDKMLHSKERDDVVTFEQLGVDRLFVDESHKFKNLGMITKMNRVAGVQTSDSQKSNDMLMKCRVMDEITGGKGVTFATGTPISNSMTELYTNMRYLQQSTLEKLDLAHFDKWASTFGETVTAMEVSPEGTSYRAKTRFAKFFNLPELMSIWKEAADVQTPDMLNLPVPETEYVDVVLDKSPEQEAILDVIGKRADVIRAGGIDSKIDNMLKITNDGRKMALDQRLINDMLPDNPNSKAATCAENIASIYKDTMEQKSAQIVFCDLGTPSANGKNDKFNVYNDLKEKLIEKGIPAEEIAFIHDAKTGTQKDTLFSNVRSGKVRVIIGSTEKMGAGTNIQDRLIALHHMDVPWRPADLEQQEGRIIRRGNQNSKVKIFRYITKGTFDTYNWQTIENKQTFIGQIMTSKSPVRSHEDIDNAALKYAEVKALATDNPLIAEKMNLEVEVQKLKAAKVSHNNQIYAMQDNVTKTYPESIAKDKELIKAFKKDILTYNEHKPADKDSFSITIGNRTFVDKKEGAEALQDAIKSGAKYVGDYGKIGSYRGFDVMVKLDLLFNKFDLKLSGETAHQVMDVGHDAFGNVNKMNNVLDSMPQNLEKIVQRLEKTEKSLEVAKVEMTKPFPKEEELKEKMQRLSEVDSLLRMDEKEPVIIDTGDEMDTPTKACEDISEMIEDKSETKIFGVSYRNEKDFGNMVYLECDNEDTAKDFVKDLIPGCTVERGIEVSKVPDGKQVFNVAKEKERMAQKALEKAGKGKTANGIE